MNTEFRKNVVEVESYCALLDTQSCRNFLVRKPSLQHFDDFHSRELNPLCSPVFISET